jgi:hypothetical protein
VGDPVQFLAKRARGFVAAFSSRIKPDHGIYVIAVDDGGRFRLVTRPSDAPLDDEGAIRADLVGCYPLPPLDNYHEFGLSAMPTPLATAAP